MTGAYVAGQMHTERMHFEWVETGERLRFVISATDGADRWSNAGGTATTNYEKGIDNYTGDWASATVAQKNAMRTNLVAAIDSGKWEGRVLEVGTSQWKSITKSKSGNYSSGYNTGKSKYLAAAQKLYPYIGAGQAQVKAMPKGTLQQAKDRALFWMDYMAAYQA